MIHCQNCSSDNITEIVDEVFTHQCGNCGSCMYIDVEPKAKPKAKPKAESKTKPKK